MRRISSRRIGGLIATLMLHSSLFTLCLHAQSLAECIAYAKEHSLRVKQSDLQVERARRNEGSYFQLDKTQLSLSQDPTSGGSPDNALTLSQSIDFPTVYTTRRKMLKAETQVSESQKLLTMNELVKDVSMAYCRLLYCHQLVALYQRNDSVLDSFVQKAQVRLTNGDTNQLEVMNARQQKADNLIRLQQEQNNERTANLTLQQLMNTDISINPSADTHLDVNLTLDVNDNAKLRMLESERQLKERELSYIRQGYMPSFSLGTRHEVVIPGVNPYHIERTRNAAGGWMGFEVGVSFPLFFGSQRAKTAVAKYDLDIANTQLQESRRQQQTDYTIARQNVLTAQDAYNKYHGELLAQAHEMRRLSLVEYNAGEISYVEHIQNISSALSIELNAAASLLTLREAIITFNFVTGKTQ